MKKSVFLFLFVAFSGILFGQVFVNGVNINKADTKFCIIEKSALPIISVNYGQKKFWKKVDITDKNGTIISPKNIVTVLNFMEQNGWDLVAFSQSNSQNYSETWVFRKK